MQVVDFAQNRADFFHQPAQALAWIFGVLGFISRVFRVDAGYRALERAAHGLELRTHYVHALRIREARLHGEKAMVAVKTIAQTASAIAVNCRKGRVEKENIAYLQKNCFA